MKIFILFILYLASLVLANPIKRHDSSTATKDIVTSTAGTSQSDKDPLNLTWDGRDMFESARSRLTHSNVATSFEMIPTSETKRPCGSSSSATTITLSSQPRSETYPPVPTTTITFDVETLGTPPVIIKERATDVEPTVTVYITFTASQSPSRSYPSWPIPTILHGTEIFGSKGINMKNRATNVEPAGTTTVTVTAPKSSSASSSSSEASSTTSTTESSKSSSGTYPTWPTPSLSYGTAASTSKDSSDSTSTTSTTTTTDSAQSSSYPLWPDPTITYSSEASNGKTPSESSSTTSTTTTTESSESSTESLTKWPQYSSSKDTPENTAGNSSTYDSKSESTSESIASSTSQSTSAPSRPPCPYASKPSIYSVTEAQSTASDESDNPTTITTESWTTTTLTMNAATFSPTTTTTVTSWSTVWVSRSPSSTSSTSTTSPTPSPSQSLSHYALPILEQHNLHRQNHSVPDLSWNDTLANWSYELASTYKFHHSTDPGDGSYGQNIGAGFHPNDIDKMITNSMYNGEISSYNGWKYPDGLPEGESYGAGHFSAIVWKDTTSVGCATMNCTGLEIEGMDVHNYFTVCDYYPAGNVGGLYEQNVLEPKGMETVWV